MTYEIAERGPRRPELVLAYASNGEYVGRGVRRAPGGQPMISLAPGAVTPVRVDLSQRCEGAGLGIVEAIASPTGCFCDLQYDETELILTVWGVTPPAPDDYGGAGHSCAAIGLQVTFGTGEVSCFSIMIQAPMNMFGNLPGARGVNVRGGL